MPYRVLELSDIPIVVRVRAVVDGPVVEPSVYDGTSNSASATGYAGLRQPPPVRELAAHRPSASERRCHCGDIHSSYLAWSGHADVVKRRLPVRGMSCGPSAWASYACDSHDRPYRRQVCVDAPVR